MPSLKLHCRVSRERTGFDFKSLHEWIDEPRKKFGSEHRLKRHAYNKKDARQIKEFWDKEKGEGWGDKAIVEWLFHIALDNLNTAFKKARKVYGENVYNFFRFGLKPDSKYIFFDAERMNDGMMLKEFSDVYGIVRKH